MAKINNKPASAAGLAKGKLVKRGGIKKPPKAPTKPNSGGKKVSFSAANEQDEGGGSTSESELPGTAAVNTQIPVATGVDQIAAAKDEAFRRALPVPPTFRELVANTKDQETLGIWDGFLRRLVSRQKINTLDPVGRRILADYIRIDCEGEVTREDMLEILPLVATQAPLEKTWMTNYWSRKNFKGPRTAPDYTYEFPRWQKPTRVPYIPIRSRSTPQLLPGYSLYKGTVQPAIRLQMAQNFLADEDLYRCLYFPARLNEIAEYTQHIHASEEFATMAPIKREMVEEMEEMIELHRDSIRAEHAIKPVTFCFSKFGTKFRIQPPSTYKYGAKDYMYEAMKQFRDSPLIFPLTRGPMKDVRVTAPAKHCDRGQDADPYQWTKDVAIAHAIEDSILDEVASNEEGLHGGNPAFISTPMNYHGPRIPLSREHAEEAMGEQNARMIQLVQDLMSTQDMAPRAILRDVLIQIQRGLVGSPGANDTGYTRITQATISTKDPTAHDISEMLPKVVLFPSSLRELEAVQGVKPQDSVASTEMDLKTDARTFSDQDMALLLVLTEQSWSTPGRQLRLLGCEEEEDHKTQKQLTYKRLLIFAARVEEVFRRRPEFWPSSETSVELDILMEEINDFGGVAGKVQSQLVFSLSEALVYVDCMRDARRLRKFSNIDPDTNSVIADNPKIRLPELSCHPENRFVPTSAGVNKEVQINGTGEMGVTSQLDEDAFPRTAFKLGRTIRNYISFMAEGIDPTAIQEAKYKQLDASISELFVDSGIQSIEVLVESAGSIENLQANIILECNQNWAQRRAIFEGEPHVDYADLWSFCLEKPTGREFFSLDRWPPELQTEQRFQEIASSVPFRPETAPRDKTKKRKAAVALEDSDEDSDDEGYGGGVHERWYQGETVYPFGETPMQQAWQSFKMDEDLKDVPEFAHIYKPKRSYLTRILEATNLGPSPAPRLDLPPLPKDWTPSNPWPKPKGAQWKDGFRHGRKAAEKRAAGGGLGRAGMPMTSADVVEGLRRCGAILTEIS